MQFYWKLIKNHFWQNIIYRFGRLRMEGAGRKCVRGEFWLVVQWDMQIRGPDDVSPQLVWRRGWCCLERCSPETPRSEMKCRKEIKTYHAKHRTSTRKEKEVLAGLLLFFFFFVLVFGRKVPRLESWFYLHKLEFKLEFETCNE